MMQMSRPLEEDPLFAVSGRKRRPAVHTGKSPLAPILLLALCATAGIEGTATAGECGSEVRRLQQLVRVAYNNYYFSSPDRTNRCAELFPAIASQQRLPQLLAKCDHDEAAAARRQLQQLEDLAEDRANCD